MSDNLRTCLVTGGAGFIGCAVSSRLAERYRRVVIIDNLHPQVHSKRERPSRLDERVELFVGDIINPADLDTLLKDFRPDDVIHLAAETGTGQSLTEATRHGLVNVVGTTSLIDALARHSIIPRRIVLSSSRAVYGEGEWEDGNGAPFSPGQRTIEQLQAHQWDFPNARVRPSVASRTPAAPISVYGATKLAQEHILSSWATSFGSEFVNLRFQNVYGEGQSLTNSYTGIVVLFCRLGLAGQSIPLYEDGGMLRDFVHVSDVARSIIAALDCDSIANRTFDIGTGIPTSIAEVAQQITNIYGSPPPHVCHKFRFGDVRHAFCSVDEARKFLSWTPQVQLDIGLKGLAHWVALELAKEQK